MPREKECFRDNMAEINTRIPDKMVLTKTDIKRVTGWSYNTIRRRFRFNSFGEISKADFCRQISS